MGPALRDHRDVLGAAETGSGKTLAFGLPILQKILDMQEGEGGASSNIRGRLHALIFTPTRELALQVKDHLTAIARPLGIKVAAVVGGLAMPKQDRLLSQGPEIVVGTPGRLWEVISSGNPHFRNIATLRFLVVDEADRMMEEGHFAELANIFRRLPQARTPAIPMAPPTPAKRQRPLAHDAKDGAKRRGKGKEAEAEEGEEEEAGEEAGEEVDEEATEAEAEEEVEGDSQADEEDEAEEAEDEELSGEELDKFFNGEDGSEVKEEIDAGEGVELGDLKSLAGMETMEAEEEEDPAAPRATRQTFIFSATLLLSSKTKPKEERGRKGKKNRAPPLSPVERVMQQCGLRAGYATVDLTSGKRRLKEGLDELRITCMTEDKDTYLYYLLKRNPGRTLVFVNSIDCIRRILSILKELKLEPLGLHAQMQQRQRLKNLDRFKERENGILIASDVAARGLDIKVRTPPPPHEEHTH